MSELKTFVSPDRWESKPLAVDQRSLPSTTAPSPAFNNSFYSLPTMATTLDQPHLDPLAGGPAVNSASITPPQSANGKKDVPEGVPSELSDLELDPKAATTSDANTPKKEDPGEEEPEQEIEPDHYYGGGKVPVFKPVSPSPSSTPGPGPMSLQLDRLRLVEEVRIEGKSD